MVIGEETLADEERLSEEVEVLHRAWVGRRPVRVELGVEASELRRPVTERRAPWRLGPGYTPLRERLQFLVWANNWDWRGSEPVWWWGRKAERLGARSGGRADVILPGGQEAWVDGGPRIPLDLPVVHSQTVAQGRLTLQPPAAASGADLAEDQRAAVEHRSGPVRVIAPAGSGKTRTLGARLLHLVDDRGVEPGIITAVAYNNRAAREMRERLGRDDLHIRTIHSLGWAIIRDARPDAVLLDERAVRSRLGAMIPRAPRPNTDVTGPYLEGLAEIRIALRDPAQVEGNRPEVEGLAGILPRYRSLLADRTEIDYDEQICGAIELLLADPDLRRRWQGRCRHLLVDEFQDLTPAYLLLLRLLSCPELSVFGVGDDDQTIYGYAGADPRFLIGFDRYFPGAGKSALTVNYRCPSEVVTAAARLLSHNRIRVRKTIEAAAGPDPDTFRVVRPDRGEMAAESARIIAGWLEEGAEPGEMAVLARVNSALLPVLAALEQAGIAFRSRLDAGLLNRTTMRATLAWIRLALDTLSMRRSDLMEAVRRPARRINRLASELIPARDITLDRLASLGRDLDQRRATAWRRFTDAIEEASQVAKQGDAGVLLDYLSGELGLGRVARSLDSGRGRVDRSAHADDLVALRRTAAVYQDLSTFERRLRELLGGRRSAEGGVTATTIHRVKGLEWERVIVFGADAGLIPHQLAEDLEEERRVLHVAITRCGREVVVMAERGRESPFLPEFAEEYRPVSAIPPAPAPPGRRALTPAGASRAAEPRTPGERAPDSPSDPPYDADLYEALREWRLGVARRDGVSAFIVAYNRTLEEIARTRPRTEAELMGVPGIGAQKLAAYGRDILDLVHARGTRPAGVERRPDTATSVPSDPPKPPPSPETATDPGLLDALRRWRGDLARSNGLPAYTIVNNHALEEIARTRPRTPEALLAVRGIGPAKLEKYGPSVLDLVKSHDPDA